MANTESRRRPFRFTIGVDENGVHSVFSTTEPVFCFLRNSEEEAVAIAEETWRDYVARFGRSVEPMTRAGREVTLRNFKTTREVELA